MFFKAVRDLPTGSLQRSLPTSGTGCKLRPEWFFFTINCTVSTCSWGYSHPPTLTHTLTHMHTHTHMHN